MALTILITNAGRAALINADRSGTRAVRVATVGVSPTATVPAATATALPGEIKRIATISGAQTAADMIHLTVQDESAAVYTVRSFGLYLDDGTLFAIYGQADVIVEKSAQALLLLAIDVTLQDIAATSITFGNANFLLPAATTERQGLVELATSAEARAGTDGTRALTPASAVGSVPYWLGYTPVQMGTGIGQSTNAVKIGWSGFRLRVTVDASDLGALVFDSNIADVWRSSNDGSGSGLDADLLDGQDGSFYSNIVARLGYTPVQMGTGIGQLNNAVKIGWSGTRLKVTVDFSDQGNVVFDKNIADVWRSSNDGAGSGLDADLLDGRHATDFILKSGDTFGGQVAIRAPAFGLRISNVGTGYGFLQFGEASDANVGFNWHLGSLGEGSFGLFQGQWGSGTNRLLVTSAYINFNGQAMWHAGNDGAGSGLDADLLDGLESTYFTNIVARLGYTPVQMGTGVGQSTNAVKIGWSGTRLKVTVDASDLGALAFDAHIADVWRSSNDGSGSGLDADLLDGRQASDFALLSGAAFTGNVDARDLTASRGDGTGVVFLNGDKTRHLYYGPGGYDLPRAGLTINGGTAWSAVNDGAGSGLDSDLVDGWQADDLRRWGNLLDRPGSFPPSAHGHGAADIAGAFASASHQANGYQVLPGGLILQWVTGPYQAPGVEAAVFVGWPIAFPNVCLQAFPSTQINAATDRGDSWFQLVGDPATDGCTVFRQRSGNPVDNAATAPKIFAIGR